MTRKSKEKSPSPVGSIYRRWHLGKTAHDALTTEFEWAMLRFHQAFERWALQVTASCGYADASFSEVTILHATRMHGQPCTAALIARQLNRDDIPNLQYSLRKLVNQGYLARNSDSRKNYTFEVTERGRQLTDRYAEIRHAVLTEQTREIDAVDERLEDAVKLISMLTGQYDEAMRKATTYTLTPVDGPPDEDEKQN